MVFLRDNFGKQGNTANKGMFDLKITVFLVFLIFLFATPALAALWPGSGTSGSPYLIADANDMQAIGADDNYWDAHFKLTADIDLSSYTGTSFNIIGSGWDEPFTGVFDGNGYKIYNFSYGPIASDDYVGIFGMVGKVNGASGEIKNLGLINPSIDVGAFMTGALAGRLVLGTITDCYVEGGSVSGDGFVGGLVGSSGFINGDIINCYTKTSVSGDGPVGGLVGMNDGTVYDCYAAGNIVGNSDTGGLVGDNKEDALIAYSYASGIIQGTDDAGGLAGRNWGGTILNCYATGNVSGDNDTGGLVGKNSGANGFTGTIINCYATGDVTGYYNAGGLIGSHAGFIEAAEIINCYCVGGVSGDTNVGGLIGSNFAGSVVDSFWDKTTSGQSTSAGGSGAMGRTTALMKTMTTFTDYGWDFVGETINSTENHWRMCVDGVYYPKLSWEFPMMDFLCPDGVDFIDYSYFADCWDVNDPNCDFDESGYIDANDLILFGDDWLRKY